MVHVLGTSSGMQQDGTHMGSNDKIHSMITCDTERFKLVITQATSTPGAASAVVVLLVLVLVL